MRYELIKIERGWPVKDSKLILEADNNEDLIVKLKDLGDSPYVQGINFEYITNRSHYRAAGYGLENNLDSYSIWRAPAHFNPVFYEILTIKEEVENLK